MNTHADKTQENKSRAVADDLTTSKSSNPVFQLVDNRPEAISQRKLIELTKNSPRATLRPEVFQSKASISSTNQTTLLDKAEDNYSTFQTPTNRLPSENVNSVAQRQVHHDTTSPFTEAEATEWNSLLTVANRLGVGSAFIDQVENDIYDPTTGATLANSIVSLKAQIRSAILNKLIPRTDADDSEWGDFQPFLSRMAAQYGRLTGPRQTGGHAANTYTYTVNGTDHHIAEETNAHGQRQENLITRRREMRSVIDDFNAEVRADAARY